MKIVNSIRFLVSGRKSATPAVVRLDSRNYEPVTDRVMEWSPAAIAEDPKITELMTKIYRKYQHGRAEFDQHIQPILTHAIEYYGPLPASQNDHHKYRNGLIEHVFEVTHDVIQSVIGTIEPGKEMKGAKRGRNEQAYYQAIVLSALLHDVGKPVTDITVRDNADPTRIWDPLRETLAEFCQAGNSFGINWEWVPRRHKLHDKARYPIWVASNWVQKLGITITPDVYPRLFSALEREGSSPISSEILKWDGRSRTGSQSRVTGFESGQDGLQVIRDTVEYLFSVGQWKYNRPGNVVWVTEHGLLLVHPKAMRDLLDQMRYAPGSTAESRFVSGEEILAKLDEAKLLERHTGDSGKTSIVEKFKPAKLSDKAQALHGIRITNPAALGFCGMEEVKPAELTFYGSSEGAQWPNSKKKPESTSGKKPAAPSEEEIKRATSILAAIVNSPDHLEQISTEEDVARLPWPAGFDGLDGTPTEILGRLQLAGWASGIEDAPGRSGKVISFRGEASAALVIAYDEHAGAKKGSATTMKDPAPESSTDDEMIADFVNWLVDQVKSRLLTIAPSVDALGDDLGFVDENGVLSATNQLGMIFLGNDKQWSRTSYSTLKQALIERELIKAEGDRVVYMDAFATHLRGANS